MQEYWTDWIVFGRTAALSYFVYTETLLCFMQPSNLLFFYIDITEKKRPLMLILQWVTVTFISIRICSILKLFARCDWRSRNTTFRQLFYSCHSAHFSSLPLNMFQDCATIGWLPFTTKYASFILVKGGISRKKFFSFLWSLSRMHALMKNWSHQQAVWNAFILKPNDHNRD